MTSQLKDRKEEENINQSKLNTEANNRSWNHSSNDNKPKYAISVEKMPAEIIL